MVSSTAMSCEEPWKDHLPNQLQTMMLKLNGERRLVSRNVDKKCILVASALTLFGGFVAVSNFPVVAFSVCSSSTWLQVL